MRTTHLAAAERLSRLRRPFPATGWTREHFANAAREGRRRWEEAEELFGVQWPLFQDAVSVISPTFAMESRFADVAEATDVPGRRNVDNRIALWFMRWARCPHTADYPNPYARDVDLKWVRSHNGNSLGLEWNAQVSLRGPDANGTTDRGVKQITVGFIQNLTPTEFRGLYALQGQATWIDRSEQENTTYWDSKPGQSGKWYSSAGTALLNGETAKTGLIKNDDSPGSGPPLRSSRRGVRALTRMQFVWNFRLYVAARTSDIGGQMAYVGQAQANWVMRATADIVAGAWQPRAGDNPGITPPPGGWGPVVDNLTTEGPQFNSILARANFVVVQ